MAEFHRIKDRKELELMANTVRQDIIRMLYEAKSGHPAGSLGLAEVLTALYFGVMRHDPGNPGWEGRDRFILSNGHVCPVLYSAMARSGYFPVEELLTLRQPGSRLQGHPHRSALPGLETSSGPLGQGLSQAVGMAIVAKTERKKWHVWAVLSDGELQEGQSWEAFMLAAKYKLGNLTAIIDRNKIQIDGTTEDVCPLEPLADKFRAFGWKVVEVDGHDVIALIKACGDSREGDGPAVIIARTVPGKGVSFMEGLAEWHGKPPKEEHKDKALAELAERRKEIESG